MNKQGVSFVSQLHNCRLKVAFLEMHTVFKGHLLRVRFLFSCLCSIESGVFCSLACSVSGLDRFALEIIIKQNVKCIRAHPLLLI